MIILLGISSVVFAGLLSGSGAWPMKLMRWYRFEHWWFVGMLVGLVIFPWSMTIIFCPHVIAAIQSIPSKALWQGNLWSTGWGVANILCGLCYIRIGMALTTAILSGLGICLGVTIPLLVKGSGSFEQLPRLISPVGLTILTGMLFASLAVLFAGKAGLCRDRAEGRVLKRSGNFAGSLFMATVAGFLSCGFTMSFVYGQGPIITAFKNNGAGEFGAAFAVWAVALGGGTLLSVGYAVFLLTKDKSWGVFLESWREFGLAVLIGLNIAVSVVVLGKGMLLMGALGGSIGAGLQQISWMLGGQGVGIVSGEWRGVKGRPRTHFLIALGLLLVAALIMACGNFFAQSGVPQSH